MAPPQVGATALPKLKWGSNREFRFPRFDPNYCQDLIRGVGNELPVIQGYGEGTLTVTAGLNVTAGIPLFRSLMEH